MKLSICIPTYNRSAHLKAILTLVYRQLEKFDLFNVVEVIVSDNQSTDDTTTIVEPYLNKGLKYSKNEVNIGPDANFLKLFELAVGTHLWLPGDDDTFNEDTIPLIVGAIDKYNFDYLFLRTGGPAPVAGRGFTNASAKELLALTTINTTFMTSQVIRTSLIKKHLQRARKFLGGYMAYYSIFLNSLFESRVCLISECKEVYPEGAANSGGYRFYNVWSVSVQDVLLDSPFGSDRRLVKRFITDMLLYLLVPLTFQMRANASGFKSESEDPSSALVKYYGGPVSSAVWKTYLKLNVSLLRPLHFLMRVGVKLRKVINRHIA